MKPTNLSMIETALKDAGCVSVTIQYEDVAGITPWPVTVSKFDRVQENDDIAIESFTINHREYEPLQVGDLVSVPHTNYRGIVKSVPMTGGRGRYLLQMPYTLDINDHPYTRDKLVLLHRGDE